MRSDLRRVLRLVPTLSACADDELAQVVGLFAETELEPGETFACDDGRFVVIVEGTAQVHDDGRSLGALTAPSVLNELTLLGMGRGRARLEAVTRLRLYSLDPTDLRQVLDRCPSLASKLRVPFDRDSHGI